MRHTMWFALLLVFGCNAAMAQVCCPAGCVQNANTCVTSGPTPAACAPIPCWGTSGGTGSSGGGSSGGASSEFPQPAPCLPPNGPDGNAMIKKYADKCLADLTATAEFWGCLFEDEAGKAQDKALNMTCAQRKAAYAAECSARCTKFSTNYVNLCQSHAKGADGFWQDAFGDLGGTKYPAARVEGCGPPPKPAGPTAPRPKDAGGAAKPPGPIAPTPKDTGAPVRHF